MKCHVLWFGGSNYAVPDPNRDAEYFPSVSEARNELRRRAENVNGRTPCVEGSEMLVFFGPSPDFSYPDLRLYFGPRGGIKTERC